MLIPQGFGVRRIIWAAVLSGSEYFASQYMRSFWADKGKVPMMDEYNDAISDTVNVIGMSDVLAMGWGLMAVLKFIAQ